ncbi:MAG TPA: FAD-dependent oxidoreductase, partial [Dehalococcoidia bacterium]|nr:FAD-dependent oxidoreductase [Dehalococcoidia bacterium]
MGRRAGHHQVTPLDAATRWGTPPWQVSFEPATRPLPQAVDVAIIGAGFTGLAAAAWLGRLSPGTTVAVLEAGRPGAGASGRTGGVALDETAAGPLPGLGAVLDGFIEALDEFQIQCDLQRTGAWEISRHHGRSHSPLAWQDSGLLRVVHEVPGA